MYNVWTNTEYLNSSSTLGPFIREKISRGLHKKRTPRINDTKSTFTAFSSRGLSWPGSLYSYKTVPFACYVRRGQSKPRLIFSRINGPIMTPKSFRKRSHKKIRKGNDILPDSVDVYSSKRKLSFSQSGSEAGLGKSINNLSS